MLLFSFSDEMREAPRFAGDFIGSSVSDVGLANAGG
jgi:hypothetical protein